MKPRLLDLFCGAGGAARGYQQAGFHVTGVDIAPQPNYCGDEFHQANALEFPLEDFNIVHASPPCQSYTTMNNRWGSSSPDLISLVRERLLEGETLYVIENVPGARRQLRHPKQICGKAVGLTLHRHRLFETNFPFLVAPCFQDGVPSAAVYGANDQRRLMTRVDGTELRAATLEEASKAMGIDWMTWDEIREAIPPAFTETIGHQLIQQLQKAAA